MKTNDILKEYDPTNPPPEGAIKVQTISDDFKSYKIGYDSKGNLIFLIQPKTFDEKSEFYNYNGENLSIIFDFEGKNINEDSKIQKYICLRLVSTNLTLVETFASMCTFISSHFGNYPDYRDVAKHLISFRNLFINFSKKPTKSEIGLFGELLIINESKNPDHLVEGWHITGKEIFDFTIDSNQLEVKTTTLNERIHKVKHSQHKRLREMTNGYISSIIIMESDNGKTISNIAEEIRSKLNQDTIPEFNQKLASCVGSSFENYNSNFNYSYSKDSIRFYRAHNLQTISDKDVPENISDIKYSLNLETYDELSSQELFSYFNLVLR